jgi:hypothetical protein
MHSSQMCLALFLLQEIHLGTASFFYPWLQVMPASFHHIPTFFSAAELEPLHGSVALRRIKEKKADLKREFTQIQKVTCDACLNPTHSPDVVVWWWRRVSWCRSAASSVGRSFVGRATPC